MAYSVLSSWKLVTLFCLNWVLILCVVLAFLFFFNRIVGLLITLICSLVVWNRFKISIHVQSFRVSPLAGRIFVKNLSVITKDFTMCILEGNLTWRYWFLNVRPSGLQRSNPAAEEGEPTASAKRLSLPFRFLCEIVGFELFVYNRTYAFDYVLDELTKASSDSSKTTPDSSSAHVRSLFSFDEKRDPEPTSTSQTSSLFNIANILPIEFHLKNCGIVIGNENTSSIVVASIDSAEGNFDMTLAPFTTDPARCVYLFTLQNLVVRLKPNVSYQQPIGSAGISNFNIHEEYIRKRKERRLQKYRAFWNHFRRKKYSPESKPSNSARWKGLPLYLQENPTLADLPEDAADPLALEYAIYRTILDTLSCEVVYYYDTPGIVPDVSVRPLVGPDVGNGGEAPKTGVDIVLHLATVYYGPWAERQRLSLFKAFFPQANNYMNLAPTEKRYPGDQRIYTHMEVSVRFADDKSIVRVPMREHGRHDPNTAFAWLELKLLQDSVLLVYSEFERGNKGNSMIVDAALSDSELRSLVNHNVFYRSSSDALAVHMHYPLKWKDPITWDVRVTSLKSELFALREHVALITDLLADFSAPDAALQNPAEVLNAYNLFRPCKYSIHWLADVFLAYLNVNAQNIVDNPVDFEDNAYVLLKARAFEVDLLVPLLVIYQKASTLDFTAALDDLALGLFSPAWSTLHTFLPDRELARGSVFRAEGSYTYHSEVEPDLVDTVILKCKLADTTFQAYGFLIKAIIEISQNYFGENAKFQTLEEYTEKKAREKSAEKPTLAEFSPIKREIKEPKPVKRTENEIDVLFLFCVDNGCLVLPCHLYDCNQFIACRLPNFDIDIRFTNYYMDLQCDILPLKVSHVTESAYLHKAVHDTDLNGAADMFVDGVTIHGHRIFGMPPVEPTYICKWDISTGSVSLDTTGGFIQAFKSALMNVAYTFADLENSLVVEIPILYDVTIFRFTCPVIDIVLNDKPRENAMHVRLSPVTLCSNDLSNARYTSRFDAKIDDVLFEVYKLENKIPLVHAAVAMNITNFCKKRDFFKHQKNQQDHIYTHDAPFHRAPFFLFENNRDGYYNKSYGTMGVLMLLPDVPPPVTRQTVDLLFESFPFSKEYRSDDVFDDSMEESLDSLLTDENEDSLLDFLPKKPLKKASSARVRKTVLGSDAVFDPGDDTQPSLDMLDTRYEYDNFVVNVSAVDVFCSTEAVDALAAIASEFVVTSAENILDSMQFSVTSYLLGHDSVLLGAKNFRIILPSVGIHFGPFKDGLQESDFDAVLFDEKGKSLQFFGRVFKDEYASVVCDSPSIALGLKNGSIDQTTLAMRLPSLTLEVSRANRATKSAFVDIDSLELWMDEGGALAVLTNIDDISIKIQPEDIIWLSETASHYQTLILPGLERLAQLPKERADSEASLLYRLSVASEHFNIHHDSLVLTKPTYIIRNLEKRHIRSYDSWRILIRLRHILKNLPSDWEKVIQASPEELQNHVSAFERVMNIFSKWRSWESTDMREAHVFKHAFPRLFTKEVKNAPAGYSASIESIGIYSGEDGIRITKIEAELFEEDLSSTRGAISIEDIDLRLSPISEAFLETIDFFLQFKSGTSASTEENYKEKPHYSTASTFEHLLAGKKASIFVSVVSLRAAIAMEKLALQWLLDTFSCSTLYASEDQISLNIMMQCEDVSHSISCGGEAQSKSYASGVDISVIHTGSILDGLTVFDGQVEQHGVEIINGSQEYLHTLKQFVYHDMKHIKIISRLPMNEPQASKESGTFMDTLQNMKLRGDITLKKGSINAEILSPFLVCANVEQCVLRISLADAALFTDFSYKGLTIDVIRNAYGKTFLVRYSQPFLRATAKAKLNEERPLVVLGVDTKEVEISIPQILRSLNDVLSSLAQVQHTIKQFSDLTKEVGKTFSRDPKPAEPSVCSGLLLDKAIFKVFFKSSIFSTVLNMDSTRYVLSFSETTFLFGNSVNCGDVHCELVFPNVSVDIFDKIIPKNLTRLVEFNLGVKFNSWRAAGSKRAVEATSEFSRVGFSPFTAIKVMELKARAAQIQRMNMTTDIGTGQSKNALPTIEACLQNLLVHILAYNFCFGSLYSTGEEAPKGFVFGCEKVYVITEDTLGKLSIVNGFLAPTIPDAPFYSRDSAGQRALLPNVQMRFALSKNPKTLSVRVNGEVLDVRLVLSAFHSSDHLLQSIAVFQRLKKQMVPVLEAQPTEDINYIESIGLVFSSIHCEARFEGALVRIERTVGSESALELQSPAVEIGFGYRKQGGRHSVRFECAVFSSNNTLDLTCVPVLLDIWAALHRVMQDESMKPQESKTEAKEQKQESVSFSEVSKNVDISGSLHIQSQKLGISCAPRAKIQAVVTTGSIQLHVGNLENGLSGCVVCGPLTVRLQHVYSREVSALVELGEIRVQGAIESGKHILGSAELCSVDVYMKTSQMLDLAVFAETWKVSSPGKPAVGTQRSQTFAEKVQHVLRTQALPWHISLVVGEVKFSVDLGQQLGTASLELNTLWLVQAKGADWEQTLLVGLEELSVKSEGRLAACVMVRQLRAQLVITWAAGEQIFDIPLVYLSGVISSLLCHVSFDYHTVLVAKMADLYLALFNQRARGADRLVGVALMRLSSVHATCLVALTMLDIASAFQRIFDNMETLYREVFELGIQPKPKKHKEKDLSIVESFTNLETQVSVTFERFVMQIYPDTLTDTDVLVIDSGRLSAKYSRLLGTELSLRLSVEWSNLSVSLLSFKSGFEEKVILNENCERYLLHAQKARGGTIFMLPLVLIYMETQQAKGSKVIRYRFNSSFGGKVDIRWQLKSVNFIRSMYETHEKLVAARLAKNRAVEVEKLDAMEIKAKVEHAEHDSEYTYIAMEEPIIEPPQLKELGDVTPPLEWFGVHRKGFPALTHYFFILPLEKLVVNVEKQYNTILGKA